MKKLLAILALLSIIFMATFFISCDCTNSNINPDDINKYSQYGEYGSTNGSTGVGTVVH